MAGFHKPNKKNICLKNYDLVAKLQKKLAKELTPLTGYGTHALRRRHNSQFNAVMLWHNEQSV